MVFLSFFLQCLQVLEEFSFEWGIFALLSIFLYLVWLRTGCENMSIQLSVLALLGSILLADIAGAGRV
jgi:hypothetical protein